MSDNDTAHAHCTQASPDLNQPEADRLWGRRVLSSTEAFVGLPLEKRIPAEKGTIRGGYASDQGRPVLTESGAEPETSKSRTLCRNISRR